MKKEDHPYFYTVTSISSIISGMFAKIICHPFDTFKSRLQANTSPITKGYGIKIFNSMILEGFKGIINYYFK